MWAVLIRKQNEKCLKRQGWAGWGVKGQAGGAVRNLSTSGEETGGGEGEWEPKEEEEERMVACLRRDKAPRGFRVECVCVCVCVLCLCTRVREGAGAINSWFSLSARVHRAFWMSQGVEALQQSLIGELSLSAITLLTAAKNINWKKTLEPWNLSQRAQNKQTAKQLTNKQLINTRTYDSAPGALTCQYRRQRWQA